MSLTERLAKAINREFPNQLIARMLDQEFAIILPPAPGEYDALIKDIDSIVYHQFEGHIRDVEYAVVEDYGYMTVRARPEIARIR